jgi:hypothetical protein
MGGFLGLGVIFSKIPGASIYALFCRNFCKKTRRLHPVLKLKLGKYQAPPFPIISTKTTEIQNSPNSQQIKAKLYAKCM